MLFYILFFTFLGSVLSLIGGIVLLFKEKIAVKISHFLFSFAAGTLLGVAFLDLIPEAIEAHSAGSGQEAGNGSILFWVLIGMLTFFLLERFIHWFHHHHEHEEKDRKHTIPLILIGDSVHNFIDGVAIAAAFLVNIPLGIATAFAVAAHEIPQEIGDFGILLHRGMKARKVLLFNVLSSFTAILGALLTFFAGAMAAGLLPFFLALTAGFFIYIAASDLIPEIHNERRRGFALIETLLLFLGVLLIFIFVGFLE